MRETLRYLASLGKTVLSRATSLRRCSKWPTSLASLRLAGWFAKAHEQLLNAEGIVRVRVATDQVAAAAAALAHSPDPTP